MTKRVLFTFKDSLGESIEKNTKFFAERAEDSETTRDEGGTAGVDMRTAEVRLRDDASCKNVVIKKVYASSQGGDYGGISAKGINDEVL
jgi:hypothetical protein